MIQQGENKYALRARRLTLEKERIQQQISYLEQEYLTSVKQKGYSVLFGPQRYFHRRTKKPAFNEKPIIRSYQRIFSLTSMNSQASRDLEKQYLKTKPSPKEPQGRVTRSSVRRAQQQAESLSIHSVEQFSVSAEYSRDGSLNYHQRYAEQYLPEYASEDDERTLSDNEHFYSQSTLTLSQEEVKPRPPVIMKKQKNQKLTQPANKRTLQLAKTETKSQPKQEAADQIYEGSQTEEKDKSEDSLEIFMQMVQRQS